MPEQQLLQSRLRYIRNNLTREHKLWQKRYACATGAQFMVGAAWGTLCFDKIQALTQGSAYLFALGMTAGCYLAHRIADRSEGLYYASVASRNPLEWTEVQDGRMRILQPKGLSRRKNLKTLRLALLMGASGVVGSALMAGVQFVAKNHSRYFEIIPLEQTAPEKAALPKQPPPSWNGKWH